MFSVTLCLQRAGLLGLSMNFLCIHAPANNLPEAFPVGYGHSAGVYLQDQGFALLYVKENDLWLRTIDLNGNHRDEIVRADHAYFSPENTWRYRSDTTNVGLIVHSSGQPGVVIQDEIWLGKGEAGWGISENPGFPGPYFDNFQILIDRTGRMHVVGRYYNDNFDDRIGYRSFSDGSWSFAEVGPVANDTDDPQSYAPRMYAAAYDRDGWVHIAYCREIQANFVSGGTQVRGYLNYATNRGGSWKVEEVDGPGSGYGDAGLGVDIAINPTTNRPVLASGYIARVATGSPQGCQLRLFTQNENRVWQRETLLTTSSGYSAGDGQQGTGFSPSLCFDPQGGAHLLFLDHASQHFAGFGADQFAGNLRYGYRPPDGHWQYQVIFPQNDPIRNQMVYPFMIPGDGKLLVGGVIRRDTLGPGSVVESTQYELFTQLLEATFSRPGFLGDYTVDESGLRENSWLGKYHPTQEGPGYAYHEKLGWIAVHGIGVDPFFPSVFWIHQIQHNRWFAVSPLWPYWYYDYAVGDWARLI